MTQELSYMQLRTANEAREAEEQRLEQRKRTLLILIHHCLREEGYVDTANALEKEGGVALTKYEVCDNIDLPTVLQEYESYHFVKFNRMPKIIKKKVTSADSRKVLPPKSKTLSLSSRSSSVSLPSINGSSGLDNTQSPSSTKRPSSDGKRKSTSSSTKQKLHQKNSSPPSNSSPTTVSSDLNLAGTSITNTTTRNPPNQVTHGKNVIIDMRAMLNNAIKGDYNAENDPSEKLLKPLGGFAGLTGEWRDLAAVISRDIYLHNPDVRWDDIIGLDAAKRLVKEAVVYPIKYPQLFTGILSPWKGLLLYGPPGTGKTLLAKAVATECKTTFFNISASSIVSKWRGDSEKLVRVLFELARFHAPSTIFLDELESLMSQRGIGGGGSNARLFWANKCLTATAVENERICSTFHRELDHAMLRRLEKRILVDLPTLQARQAMLQQYLPPLLHSGGGSVEIKTEIDYEKLAARTEGYSGSDIRLLCKEAAMRKVRKIFDLLESHHTEDEHGRSTPLPSLVIEPVKTEDVEAALKHTKPSARQLKDKYNDWQREYESV
ncbi:PREDICTED: katanin p60 ATPase-containing subunit A-like 2 [Acropora digitifera]|uniref:katanin p60 ATPase-containing subunit A-like 2 n=1 Tax=Acropora digitifera TaxID=70779 RepID=UPI00077A1455|nr:PREDICTED: katanin p60 ATPase-containing subunit A-like 2 [Acropora digitifera]